ncbi:MAG: hypothetical protein BGO51_01630 [Rhodospirillales bacterium 69-11]|nr:tetratricopeptide repeat protein [Rhodospirillales bacterium]OJW25310.1 MAG: hypothetical protein BGO51_01630 [Rhodospirillales bacterium 69-11]
MRRIVMIGNCQVSSMMTLYKRFVAVRTGDVVDYVASYADLDAAAKERIRNADVVVEQLLDLKPAAESEGLSDAPRVRIPMVTAAFLWPFAGQEHPKNERTGFLPSGPYGAEASDGYLNRLLQQGLDPDEAAAAYLALDVGQKVNLDRLYELVMDRQRSRDEAAGYRIADSIARHFRSEPIFLTPYHPHARIARVLAEQLFRQLGASRADIERMRNATLVTPFPKEELPIHPAVARHFDLQWVGPQTSYRLLNEGRFTFPEFVARYVRVAWNPALEEGIVATRTPRLPEAEALLRQGLAQSPRSGAGWNALRSVLLRQGRVEEALQAGRRAVMLEPDLAPYRSELGSLHRDAGRWAEAEAEFRRALLVNPSETRAIVLLAHVLKDQGRLDEAFATVMQGLEGEPYAANLHRTLAHLFEATGQIAEAVAALDRVLALTPDDPGARARRDELAKHAGKSAGPPSTATPPAASRSSASAPSPQQAAASPGSPATQGPPSQPEDGIQQLRRATDADPANPHLAHELSAALQREGRLPEALAAARLAATRDPRNPFRQERIGHLASRLGDLAAAEQAFRAAVEIAPHKANFRTPLSDVLIRQGRLPEGVAEARRATEVDPGNPKAFGFLAHALTLAGEIEAAEAAVSTAIGLDPRDEALAAQLAALRQRRARGER